MQELHKKHDVIITEYSVWVLCRIPIFNGYSPLPERLHKAGRLLLCDLPEIRPLSRKTAQKQEPVFVRSNGAEERTDPLEPPGPFPGNRRTGSPRLSIYAGTGRFCKAYFYRIFRRGFVRISGIPRIFHFTGKTAQSLVASFVEPA